VALSEDQATQQAPKGIGAPGVMLSVENGPPKWPPSPAAFNTKDSRADIDAMLLFPYRPIFMVVLSIPRSITDMTGTRLNRLPTTDDAPPAPCFFDEAPARGSVSAVARPQILL